MKKIDSTDISFTKVDMPYGWLGNMSPFPIVFQDQIWLTAEALFQSLRFEEYSIKEEIRAQKSPMSAKMKAKSYRNKMAVIPMSHKDIKNMEMCISLKLNQNPSLIKWLRTTGERKIFEDIGCRKGARHLFWGAKKENGFWIGENVLGEVWMKARKDFFKIL